MEEVGTDVLVVAPLRRHQTMMAKVFMHSLQWSQAKKARKDIFT